MLSIAIFNRRAVPDAAVREAHVTDTESLRAAIAAAMARSGRVDILLYNVGVSIAGGDGPLEVVTEKVFDRVMAINLRGAIMAAKIVEHSMRKQRTSVVINVAWMSAIETSTQVSWRRRCARLQPASRRFSRGFLGLRRLPSYNLNG